MAEYGQKITFTPEEAFFGIDSAEGGMTIQDYKPAIRVKDVWDGIFQQFGFTYTSAFFEQSWVNNVYMLANNKLRYPIYAEYDLETYGLFRTAPISGSGMTNVTMSVDVPKEIPFYNIQQNPGGQLNSDLIYTLDFNSRVRGELNLNFVVNSTGIGNGIPQFYLKIKDTSGTLVSTTALINYNNYMKQIQTYNATQTKTQEFTLLTQYNTAVLPAGQYRFYLEYTNYGGTNFQVVLNPNNQTKSYFSITKVNQGGSGLVMDMAANMPFATNGIKLIDFVSGIQKKFNLVIYPNKNKLNDFIVEPFIEWYKTGQVKDFNRYINLDKKITVAPANNYAVNELNFGDTLDQDYISQQFNRGANREFGKTYYVDTNNFFSQGKFEVKTSFASSPLIYLAGTGISGSASGGGPIAFSIGNCQLSSTGNPFNICQFGTFFEIFSSTGVLEAGAVLYFDAYGNNLVTGYSSIVDNAGLYGGQCDIWSLDTISGIVQFNTGDNCADFGGCI
jgi:hypothetical protein